MQAEKTITLPPQKVYSLYAIFLAAMRALIMKHSNILIIASCLLFCSCLPVHNGGVLPGYIPPPPPYLLMFEDSLNVPTREAIQCAVDWWHAVTGVHLFTHSDPRASLVPVLLAPYAIANTLAFFSYGEGREVIYIVPKIEVSHAILCRAIAHELGHLMGLAHDNDRDSIMYHTTRTGGNLRINDLEYVQNLVVK